MALSAKVGTFTPPGSTGNYAVTGVGFTPKALLLFVYKNQGTTNGGPIASVVGVSIGLASGSGTTAQVCAAWNVRGDSNYTTSVRWKEGAIASGSSSGANVVYIDASLASFDADGFTLNFASASTDFTAWYLVLGGSDLTQVALTALDTPTTTGTQAKTGVGFQPDALMFLSSAFNATSTSGYQSNGGAPQLGVCASGGDYAVSNWGNTFAGTTASYGRDDRAIVLLKDFSSNVWGDATLSSMDSDGFTLNWQAVSTEVTRVWALCLKGTSIKVGTTAQRTTTGTTAVTGLGFQPTALLMFSNGQVASASVANVAGMLNIGAATSTTNRQAATFGRAHNGSSYPGTAQTLASAKVAVHHAPATSAPSGSTLAADGDLSSFDADGFTLNWTTVDGTARTWGWIAFGAASAPASYSIVASGGLALGGAAGIAHGRVQAAAGTVAVSGAAVTARGRAQLASGGLQLAAAATVARGRVQPAAGAVALAGAASVVRAATVVGAGAVGWAGAAAVTRGRVQPAVGALALSGTAGIARAARLTATGSLALGGAAAISTTGSFAIIGAGGLTLGAAAALARGRVVVAAGAVALQASTPVVRGRVHPASGHVAFAGAASISTTSGYTIIGTGGVTLAGSAALARGRAQTALGAIALAGAAALTRHRVVGVGGVITFGGAAAITAAGPVLTCTLLTISRHGVTRHVGGSVRMTPSAGGRVTLTPSPGGTVSTWFEE